MGSFDCVPIDYRAEYVEARRLMGERTTNIDKLINAIGMLYLNCPAELAPAYESLLNEATRRKFAMEVNPPPWLKPLPQTQVAG